MPSHKDLTLNDLSYMPIKRDTSWMSNYHPEMFDAMYNVMGQFGGNSEGLQKYMSENRTPKYQAMMNKIQGQMGPYQGPHEAPMYDMDAEAGYVKDIMGLSPINTTAQLAQGAYHLLSGNPERALQIGERTDTAPNTAQNVQAPSSMPVTRPGQTAPVLVGNTPSGPTVKPFGWSPKDDVTAINTAHENMGASLVDPNERLQEQLDPEYMKERQNREWLSSYEVSKAKENYESAQRKAEWVAKTFAEHPTGQARFAVAMQNLQNAQQGYQAAQEADAGVMSLGAQENENRLNRDMEQQKINATIQAAQIKAGQGDGRDLQQYTDMAYNALVAGGIDAERAKAFAPTVLKLTSEGVEINHETMKMYFGLNDKDAHAFANALSHLYDPMSNDPEFKAARSAYVASNTPLTEFEKSVVERLNKYGN